MHDCQPPRGESPGGRRCVVAVAPRAGPHILRRLRARAWLAGEFRGANAATIRRDEARKILPTTRRMRNIVMMDAKGMLRLADAKAPTPLANVPKPSTIANLRLPGAEHDRRRPPTASPLPTSLPKAKGSLLSTPLRNIC